jgi:hypothetical protein
MSKTHHWQMIFLRVFPGVFRKTHIGGPPLLWKTGVPSPLFFGALFTMREPFINHLLSTYQPIANSL